MYYPGDHKVICEMCGMTYLRSECQFNWQGSLVCSAGCWEPRHPQDFVRGVPDITRVGNPRPDVSYEAGESTLRAEALALASIITIEYFSSLQQYDSVGIVLDNGDVHWTFFTEGLGVRTVSGGEERTTSQGDTRTVSTTGAVGIHAPVPSAAASGNTIYLPSISGATFLGATEVSEDDF